MIPPLFSRLAAAASLLFVVTAAEAAVQQQRMSAGDFAPLSGPVRTGGRISIERVPLIDGEPETLELERFEVFAPNADIKLFGANDEVLEQLAPPAAHYYRGHVRGREDSVVFLSMTGDSVEGLIYAADRKFAVGTMRARRGREVVIQESTALEDIPLEGETFTCGVEQAKLVVSGRPRAVTNALGEPASNAAPSGTQRSVINLAVETDYELYTKAANSGANVTTFIGNLIGAASTIYERDLLTAIRIAYLGIQSSSSDPFTIVPGQTATWNGITKTMSTMNALLELGDRWHNSAPTANARSAVALISGKNQTSGIAWINTLCDGDFACSGGNCGSADADGHYGGRYSYNGGITPPANLSVPDPDALAGFGVPGSNYWPLLQVTHELGHNVGSQHTHCVALNAAQQTQYGVSRSWVDTCYSGAGGCYSGSTSIPVEKGTIMSYCHLAGGGTATRFTFGQPNEASEVIRTNMRGYMASVTPALSAITAPASLGAGVNGNASVTNAGLTYSWTIANGTFTGGGTTATGASVTFSGSANPVTLIVTATNAQGCAVTDTKQVTIGASAPAAPTGVVATATASTSVSVSWNASATATSYNVWRMSQGGAYTNVGSTALLTFTDNAAAANTAYLYQVEALNAGGGSPLSAANLATTVIFTDPSLTAGVTAVKSIHFTQLLTAVNAVRTLGDLAPIAFSAPAPGADVSIRKAHLDQLRSGLNAGRGAIALPGLSFTDSTITAGGTSVKAAHITELRNGVK